MAPDPPPTDPASSDTASNGESVWDYPRPPVLRSDTRHAEVRFGGEVIASTAAAILVLETSHPPGWYFPPASVDHSALTAEPDGSWCEWKGRATYWSVVVGERAAARAAWSYPQPSEPYRDIAGYVSFYPQLVSCTVDGAQVRAQEGAFYGGWITPEVEGPFKGGAGSEGW